jgi:hypothetical protein
MLMKDGLIDEAALERERQSQLSTNDKISALGQNYIYTRSIQTLCRNCNSDTIFRMCV